MRSTWQDGKVAKSVTSPLSLIITGFTPITDVTKTLTPQLDMSKDTTLLYVDLSGGHTRLGGSALAQSYSELGGQTPDADPKIIKDFFAELYTLKTKHYLLAYHDRSDGGLLTTLLEMAFASRSGLSIDLTDLEGTTLEKLFNEELGVVIQVKSTDVKYVSQVLHGKAFVVGKPTKKQVVTFHDNGKVVYKNTRGQLEQWWAETSYRIQRLRDNPDCAEEEYTAILNDHDPGLTPSLPPANSHTDAPSAESVQALSHQSEQKNMQPRVAILREQGVNGQNEMAAAFTRAGFTAVDVHLNDIMQGNAVLGDFSGLVACGGFSYGDVLGAGGGWAKTILFDPKLRQQFKAFFERQDTFTLGVCNGCQMLSELKELIPGAEDWPKFLQNKSARFEARLPQVRLNKSPSLFFRGMEGSVLPIPVAHGEGYAEFSSDTKRANAVKSGVIAAQYVDAQHRPTETYPANPNGSPQGITALTTPDGRATIMMPHPERAFQTRQLSWHPNDWPADSPWLQMFVNAYKWTQEIRIMD